MQERFAALVGTEVREQGLACRLNGRVTLEDVQPDYARATVEGAKEYEVTLGIHRGDITAECTCAYYVEEHEFCKHIWGTYLLAREGGFASDEAALADTATPTTLQKPEPEDPFPLTPPPPAWKELLEELNRQRTTTPPARNNVDGEIFYHCVVTANDLAVVSLFTEQPRSRRRVPISIPSISLPTLEPEEDRHIIAALVGGRDLDSFSSRAGTPSQFEIDPLVQREVLPRMAATGRLFVRTSAASSMERASLDEEGPWKLILKGDSFGDHVRFGLVYRRDVREIRQVVTQSLVRAGLFFDEAVLRTVDHPSGFDWRPISQRLPLRVPNSQLQEFLQSYLTTPNLPAITLPPDFAYETSTAPPSVVALLGALPPRGQNRYFPVDLFFDYDGHRFGVNDPTPGKLDMPRRTWYVRDQVAERTAVAQLRVAGARVNELKSGVVRAEIPPSRLVEAVTRMMATGWKVEGEGRLFRTATGTSASISSGVDWFDLTGEVTFGDAVATLPELLKALKKGSNTVLLDDGTLGLLPEEWLRRMEKAAGLGMLTEDGVRFDQRQVGVLDALLASQPEIEADELFRDARNELLEFRGIEKADPVGEFHGTLRTYQKEGLGWMLFLQRFGFGGCLADDMGLGKTVQVLALLEMRRLEREKEGKRGRPSLAVVPRSLIHNWLEEAARFTPELRVLVHHGAARTKSMKEFDEFDLVVTTYGTMQRDIDLLRTVDFDYVILDEAQAIKNAFTQGAKSARLLQGNHRLALSGTPIENHLGELWSIFEFLNPGLLGASSVLSLAASTSRVPDDETRTLVSRAVKPFLLRRTKREVATDLPEKLEQTICCDMGPKQRKLYDELRDHYRASLLGLISQQGLAKSKFQVLEALLRLRQAACHPALIDPKYAEMDSAKMESLLPMVEEVIDGGSKALLFSQFTSMLALVRKELDERKIPYEYLDGSVRDRKERIDHWKEDPDCRLFLISLKAGGTGLNLTEAEYVFLLDPWWNPAVEAQAIDRTHRIGQTRPVFAYRLIAADTVEERILQLQETKRDLATAIVGEGEGLMRDLQREDIEMLLS